MNTTYGTITVKVDPNGDPVEVEGKKCTVVPKIDWDKLLMKHGYEMHHITPEIIKVGSESCYVYIGGKRIWVCG